MAERFLLDVNALIALVDPRHLHHDAVHAWFGVGRDWATCPVVENAFVRIISSPTYPSIVGTPADITGHLRRVVTHPNHTHISDDVRLSDETLFDARYITTPKMITDTYLLGLAYRHGLRLATLDRRMRTAAIVGAAPNLIELIPV